MMTMAKIKDALTQVLSILKDQDRKIDQVLSEHESIKQALVDLGALPVEAPFPELPDVMRIVRAPLPEGQVEPRVSVDPKKAAMLDRMAKMRAARSPRKVQRD